eukprot:gene4020-5750_t
MNSKLAKKVKERLDQVRIHGWQRLDLKNCGLTEIPSEVFDFSEVVTIDLSNDSFCDEDFRNKIEVVPDRINNLIKLSRLNLSNNKIKDVSEQIATLNRLNYLDLSNNKLTEISEKIANMSSLQNLILDNNPFDLLPPEIVARGIDSIRNFYKELQEKDYLYEVKLILVGEGRVGKTCLANALMQTEYKLTDSESTEGISINPWVIPREVISKINPKIHRDFQINIWDFGGQEIYHSTHQFFLTKRSIYMLVTESRKEDSHDDFFYWLNIIKLLGDKSPVVMVLNKCDQPTKDLPIKEYKDNFGNIIAFHKISLKEDYREDFEKFKLDLLRYASALPHIGNPLPKVWVDIRIEIEELKLKGINYISETEYFEICKKHYRNAESALFLSEYFHDLGVILHFKDDIDLKDTVILNHQWITSGVYKILDDKKVIDQKGRFSFEDIKRIWCTEEHKHKIRELISLMKNKKFDLCFELENGEFLAPRLLPVDEIEHDWESGPNNTKFEIHYKFMPKGIVARLIVKLNKEIYHDKYWRSGVMLEYENTKAIIKEKYFENKISIELSGDNKKEFLAIIRKTLNDIHRDFNKLKVEEMVPCNCSECKFIEQPTFYSFNLLKRYELKDIKTIRCDFSLQEVNVYELTSDVTRSKLSNEKLVCCENSNSEFLKLLHLDNVRFYPERDSASVFIQIKTNPDRFGLRDRDFLTDIEVEKIKQKYPNYHILDYYCFENYLYHPENISELNLDNFNLENYTKEIIAQKNQNKDHIISIYKASRKSYQEFRIESENLFVKANENDIITYLQSNEIEVFFKAFSMKDHFNKEIISKFQLKASELVATSCTSANSARLVDPIIVEETTSTRKVLFVDLNDKKKETGETVGITIVHQRKKGKETWEDVEAIPLSSLKGGEGVKLNLDSKNTRRIYEELTKLYALMDQKGVQYGTKEFSVANADEIIRVSKDRKVIIERLLSENYGEEVWKELICNQPDLATRLSIARLHSNRSVALNIFKENLDKKNSDESFWQKFFFDNDWIFGYGLNYQFLHTLSGQPDYGGRNYTGKGSQKGDFLMYSNAEIKFTVLVEIKTPVTKLLSYTNGTPRKVINPRNDVWLLSSELLAAISQIQVNARTWAIHSQNPENIRTLEHKNIYTVEPRAILIIGNIEELKKDESMLSCFESYRRNTINPSILTFDELYERAQFIVNNKVDPSDTIVTSDDEF